MPHVDDGDILSSPGRFVEEIGPPWENDPDYDPCEEDPPDYPPDFWAPEDPPEEDPPYDPWADYDPDFDPHEPDPEYDPWAEYDPESESGAGRRTRAGLHLVSCDSEWDHLAGWLSTTFSYGPHCVIYFRRKLPRPLKDRLREAGEREGVRVEFVRRSDATSLLRLFRKGCGLKGPVGLLNYYSPKDVEFALGWDALAPAIRRRQVRQRRSVTGRVGSVRLIDLFGWSNESLKKTAQALGVTMGEKELMDEYKSHMLDGLTEHPEDYLRYAVADAKILPQIRERFVALLDAIRTDCLGLGPNHRPEFLPTTLGSLVARLLEEWVSSRAGDRLRDFELACRKLGYLDPDDDDLEANREAWSRVFSRPGVPPCSEDARAVRSARYWVTALNAGGVRWWAAQPPATRSECHLALVAGGRCNNESPYSCAVGPGADVDIAGCYGEALAGLTFPVGVPSVCSYSSVDAEPTLGDWLAKHDSDLVDGLWFAVVHGQVPFGQDLIYSKLVHPGGIARASGLDGEDARIPDRMALLRKEIVNGVITADVLKTLRAVCSNKEWAGLSSLKVRTAAAYRKSNRCEDVAEWVDAVLSDPVSAAPETRFDRNTDRRSRKWVGVPLSGFVGKLSERRKEAKRCAADAHLSAEERARWAGLEKVLKLIINTVYGVLASRFFGVGNTALANNITAKARVGVWMVAKALGLRQSITDGGMYTPSAVPHWRGKNPGLATLAKMWEWADYDKGRTLKPLPGCGGVLPGRKTLDELAEEHVRSFWGPYGLTMPFRLEHKATFHRAAYWSKGDTMMLLTADNGWGLPDGHRLPKLRGKERVKRDGVKEHPTFALMNAILDDSDEFPAGRRYTKGGILKIGRYLLAQETNGYQDLKHLRPGDTLPDKEFVARYNNAHFPVDDEAEFLRRANRRPVDHGRPVEWFERYAPMGIAAVLRHMAGGRLGKVDWDEDRARNVPPRSPDFRQKGGDGGV
jgi:hypothetical protein